MDNTNCFLSSFDEKAFNPVCHQFVTSFNMGNFLSNPTTKIALRLAGHIVGLISSTSSLVVHKVYLQDLHEVMKNLLNVLSVHGIVTSILSIAVESYINFSNNNNSLETCTVKVLVYQPLFCITFELFSFMSVVRYYLAYKTQALEAPKEWMLYLIAGVIYVTEHAYIPIWYLLAINYDMPSGATECAGKNL